MDVRYINPFIVSCRKVFDTMIHVPVTIGKPYLRQRGGPHMMVSAVIGLGGAVMGCVVLRLSPQVTVALASGILGTPVAAMDADAMDAVGEIANMVAGHAKKDLPDGLATLSMPTVNVGDRSVKYPLGVPVISIPCETPTGSFVIEVAVKPAPASPAGAPASTAPPAPEATGLENAQTRTPAQAELGSQPSAEVKT